MGSRLGEYVPDPQGAKWPETTIRSYLTLFPPWETMTGGRANAFQSDLLEVMMDEIPSNASVLSELILWDYHLVTSYTAYERSYPGFDETAFAGVHGQALQHLDAIIRMHLFSESQTHEES